MGVHWLSYRLRTHDGLFNDRPLPPALGYPETPILDDLRRAAPPLLCRHVGDPSDRCLDRATVSFDERLDGSAEAHSEPAWPGKAIKRLLRSDATWAQAPGAPRCR